MLAAARESTKKVGEILENALKDDPPPRRHSKPPRTPR
jgi:hypothetical protein